jgi:hypothetical protein
MKRNTDSRRVDRPRARASSGNAVRARCMVVATLLAAGLWLVPGAGETQVPTLIDVAACNEQARDASPGSPASPNAQDEARAADARDGRPRITREHTDSTGKITRSMDAQVEGMDASGAKDASYRAAYRVCMRQKGF